MKTERVWCQIKSGFCDSPLVRSRCNCLLLVQIEGKKGKKKGKKRQNRHSISSTQMRQTAPLPWQPPSMDGGQLLFLTMSSKIRRETEQKPEDEKNVGWRCGRCWNEQGVALRCHAGAATGDTLQHQHVADVVFSGWKFLPGRQPQPSCQKLQSKRSLKGFGSRIGLSQM